MVFTVFKHRIALAAAACCTNTGRDPVTFIISASNGSHRETTRIKTSNVTYQVSLNESGCVQK